MDFSQPVNHYEFFVDVGVEEYAALTFWDGDTLVHTEKLEPGRSRITLPVEFAGKALLIKSTARAAPDAKITVVKDGADG